jgi:hypothetical protein
MPNQKLIPFKGVDIVSDELYTSENHSPFLKDIDYDLNRQSGIEGFNIGAFTPLQGNEPYCSITLPIGNNHVIGTIPIKELNQLLVLVHNSNNNHFVYRLNGATGLCQKVSESSCWNFTLKPENFISPTRYAVQVVCRFNKATGKEEKIPYVFFTDNNDDIKFFVPDDLIATSSYTTPFFSVNDTTCKKCDWFKLGVPTPMDCMTITSIKRDLTDPDEKSKPNLLAYKTWEFRLKYINVYGQDSEHGVIATQYIGVTGNSCVEASDSLARCLKLKFKAGCPIIDKIQIEFRNCSGKADQFTKPTDWFLYDTIDVYNNCDDVQWYDRTRNNPWQSEVNRLVALGSTVAAAEAAATKKQLLKYNSTDNTFEYTFCGNKERTAIPVEETNRSYNPIPITAGALFSIYKNIATARHKRGFKPIDCDELEKIDIVVTKPQAEDPSCKLKLRKITVYGIIYNPFEQGAVEIRREDNKNQFGWADCAKNNPMAYQQYFPDDQEGFIGYLAGTKHFAVSKQHRYTMSTGDIVYQGLDFNIDGNVASRQYAIQKWEFEVLPGKYVFRIASHKAKPTDEYQKTSTYTYGRTFLSNPGSIFNNDREIVVDVTSADVEIKTNPFMIYDLTRKGKGCTLVDATSVVCGYIYEDQDEYLPIERAVARPNRTGQTHFTQYTDHNGFFFAAAPVNRLRVDILGHKNCVASVLLKASKTTADAPFERHFVEEKLYAYEGTDEYNRKDRITIRGRVLLCEDNTIGVAGVLVVLTNGAFGYTDNDGVFAIVAHDDGNVLARAERIIISQRGNCQIAGCSTPVCSYSFTDLNVFFPTCTGSLTRTVSLADTLVKIRGLNKRGPTMGGRYQLGIKVHDWLGRHTYVQTREKHIIDIPSLQDTQTFDFSTIGFTINSSIQLPAYARKLSFFITENLNLDDYLTWVAERIQLVDNSGEPNSAAPTQIRLYYESLGEYNKLHKFTTTTTWQFIDDKEAPVAGDEVEFLANGDGTMFTKVIRALVKYDKDGRYVQVDYSDELKDLKDGALIRLIRPRQGTTKQIFHELCPMIDVINGVPQVLSGTFNFWDSYLMNRQLPVPVAKKKKKDPATGNEIETEENINQVKSYPFLFEHHSPSDFWGDHCSPKGRINVKNPLENEICNLTEIAVSKAIANDGILNGLHYFREEDMIVFDENEWGGITGVLAELNYLLVICEQDNFVVAFNDNQIRVAPDGRVIAPSAENRFGRPERKIGNNYGCKLKDVNTIQKYDGITMFIDRTKTALVLHNFSEAVDVSVNSVKSWLGHQIRRVSADPELYFHGCIDPKAKDYILTSFQLKGSYTDADFVNTADVPTNGNDTIAYNIYSKIVKGWRSYTPEYYGILEGDLTDQQLIAFKQGAAYKHYNTSAPYGRFFGVQCKPYISVISNIENTRVKRFLSNEVYIVGAKFEAVEVVTEANQLSRIKPVWWEKFDTFQAAPFLCDLNTKADLNIPIDTGVNKLLDGDTMYGRWLKVKYTVQTPDIGKYFEFTAVVINLIPAT